MINETPNVFKTRTNETNWIEASEKRLGKHVKKFRSYTLVQFGQESIENGANGASFGKSFQPTAVTTICSLDEALVEACRGVPTAWSAHRNSCKR